MTTIPALREVIHAQDQTIKAQQAEIETLRGLLEQWKQISPDLMVEISKFPKRYIKTHHLIVITEKTTEALK